MFLFIVLLDLVLSFYTGMHRFALPVIFDLIYHYHANMQTVVLLVILGGFIFTLYTVNTQYSQYDKNTNTNIATF